MSESAITDAELMAYLEAALDSEHGLELRTSHIDYLRRRFYSLKKIRRDAGDNRFNNIKITSSPNIRGRLWLMKEEDIDLSGADTEPA